MLEREVMHAIREAIGKDGRAVLWRNDVGAVDRTVRGRKMHTRYGLCVGSSDLIGILKRSGRFIALEVKQAGGSTTEDQDLFLQLVRNCGGFACVVRSAEDAIAAIDRAVTGADR